MILNEDYFDDLEIKDEDIMADDTPLDVEEPEQEHELTLEKVKKIPEQYSHCIRIDIDINDGDTTFIQTSLLPRIFKRLDIILESHGIEHSEYILTMIYDVKRCETVIKFGDYQLFCLESDKDEFINGTYKYKRFQIHVYLNYPKFNYKRAFRFLYTVLNLYKFYKQIAWMSFTPITDYEFDLHTWWERPNTENDDDIELGFSIESNYIGFRTLNMRTYKRGTEINLSNELNEYRKRNFYKSVFRYFFKEEVKVPYKLIDRYVPIKPLIPR